MQSGFEKTEPEGKGPASGGRGRTKKSCAQSVGAGANEEKKKNPAKRHRKIIDWTERVSQFHSIPEHVFQIHSLEKHVYRQQSQFIRTCFSITFNSRTCFPIS
jgi:hypothetical protein